MYGKEEEIKQKYRILSSGAGNKMLEEEEICLKFELKRWICDVQAVSNFLNVNVPIQHSFERYLFYSVLLLHCPEKTDLCHMYARYNHTYASYGMVQCGTNLMLRRITGTGLDRLRFLREYIVYIHFLHTLQTMNSVSWNLQKTASNGSSYICYEVFHADVFIFPAISCVCQGCVWNDLHT